jgi:L-lactate dehydrogenase complex protein LldF
VKIDLHMQLLAWRREIATRRLLPATKRLTMKLAGFVLRSTRLYTLAGWLTRSVVPRLPRFLVYNRLNPWGKQRELPEFPRQSFREVYRERARKPSEKS